MMIERHRRQASPLAAKAARDLVEELCIDHPDHIDVEAISLAFNAQVIYRDLRGEQGRLVRSKGGRTSVIAVREDLKGSPQARFVAAHELGHLLCHPELDQFRLCTSRDMSDYWNSGVEAEANQFAAELLMPRRLFEPDCDIQRPSLHSLRELARKYRTSLMATGIQFVRHSPAPCALVFSRAASVVWVRKSSQFEYYIDHKRRLLPGDGGSYAADLHAGQSSPDEPMPVSADSWTDSYRAEEQDLWEHSQAWRDEDSTCVLTLLRYRD